MMFPPRELEGYIKIENGKVVAIKEIPVELQERFDEFKKKFETVKPSIRIINTK